MIILKTPEALRQYRESCLAKGSSIGLVMTMGNLHKGHASLVQRSLVENSVTIVSIFVNPTQFNQASDYESYPRTVEDDICLLRSLNVSAVFMPEESAIYPDNAHYCVDESALSHLMEGQHRPGHFKGVLTIVMKVLLLSCATRAYFSEKDYQQLQLVQGMVEAFFLETQIIACPFLRDEKGLALSSRNARLTEQELELAHKFVARFHSMSSSISVKKDLEEMGVKVDYVTDWHGRRFIAVRIGSVRLIDNIAIGYQPVLVN
ncbi:MAG: pantoate--beta-alanine ligase [Coxiellaceae bacterium]|nr:pantoate--beta-alanine ligase [Coxiellaceae bacterium]